MEKKIWFPKVGTTEQQKFFVEEVLLDQMVEADLIERANFSDLIRWAIEEGAEAVGMSLLAPKVVKQMPGRKKKF